MTHTTQPKTGRLKQGVAVVLLAATLSACTTNPSPNSYDADAVGLVRRAEQGEVVSYRWVEVRTEKGVGTVVGAGVGGAVGSTIGRGGTGVAGAIGGALIGGLLGNAIDKQAGRKNGFEYVVRTNSGELVTLVQLDAQPIPEGAPVLILYSRDSSRLVLDESRISYERPNPSPSSEDGEHEGYYGRLKAEDYDDGK